MRGRANLIGKAMMGAGNPPPVTDPNDMGGMPPAMPGDGLASGGPPPPVPAARGLSGPAKGRLGKAKSAPPPRGAAKAKFPQKRGRA